MGITIKVLAITNAEARECLASPAHVDRLFHTVRDCAFVYEARALGRRLEELATPGSGLLAVTGASDPTHLLFSPTVKQLLASPTEPIAAVLGPVHPLAESAAASDRALLFCCFEDW